MCSYLHRATNGGYHFRMAIPADSRTFMAGKREIKHSLKLKDRAAAKARIPDMTQAANALLDQAKLDRDTTGKLAPSPAKPKPAAQIERDRRRWEAEQAQADYAADTNFAADMENKRLKPIMDALTEGIEIEGSPADLARAGRLLVLQEREKADSLVAALHARYGNGQNARVGKPKSSR
jgi:hypothetical protein